MKCFICNEKTARKKWGVYCTQKCRQKAVKKVEKQKEQTQKRSLNAEIRKFEEWEKSGYRTY